MVKVIGGAFAGAALTVLVVLALGVQDAMSAFWDLVAWSGDAGKIVAGALIGAVAAWWVARTNRNEVRRTRFHDDLRVTATDLLRQAERHRTQRQDQFTRWQEVADGGLGGPLPTVDSTQGIFDAAVALDVVATRNTAKAGWSVHGQSVYLDRPEYSYDAARHGDVAGSIVGPDLADRESFKLYLARYHTRVWEFTNAVRSELGIDPLPKPDV